MIKLLKYIFWNNNIVANQSIKKKSLDLEAEIQKIILLIYSQNNKKIEKFYEIARRKTIIDEYWDFDYYKSRKELEVINSKLRLNGVNFHKWIRELLNADELSPLWSYRGEIKYKTWIREVVVTIHEGMLDYAIGNIMKEYIWDNFLSYLEEKNLKEREFNDMTWVEFENYIRDLLIEKWFKVSNTKTTWDQWADLLINKNGIIWVAQVKRFKNNVGNKAVQEVIWAIKYYSWNFGLVITNSNYTKSAIELAQKNQILLFNGYDIDDFPNLLKQKFIRK